MTYKSVDERARAGMGVMFQRPPTVPGVQLKTLLQSVLEISDSLEPRHLQSIPLAMCQPPECLNSWSVMSMLDFQEEKLSVPNFFKFGR